MDNYKHLPPNCEIDWVELDEGTFRLVFWGDNPYYSEVLTCGKDEYAHDVGCEYIESMGWDNKWPNMPEDTEALLDELEGIAEEAIGLIEENPEAFGETWEDCLEWITPDMNGRIGEGMDVEMYPYIDGDEWKETEDSFVYVVDNGKLVEIEHSIYDGDDEDIEAIFEGPEDNEELVRATALASCHYHCLKCDLYNIYVASTGDEPLGKINPQAEHLKGVCTLVISGTDYSFSRTRGPVLPQIRKELMMILGDENQLRDDLAEIKAELGKEFDISSGTDFEAKVKLLGTDGSIRFRVKYEMTYPKADQVRHNKEVAMRGLEASVRKGHQYVVDAIAKHKTKETSNG